MPEPDGPTTTESCPVGTSRPRRRARPGAVPPGHAPRFEDLAARTREPRALGVQRHTRPSTGWSETDPLPGTICARSWMPGSAERLLGDPQPAAGTDDGGLELTRALLADAAVADVDDAVGDLRRGGIVAHEDRGRSVVGDELGQEREDVARRLRVEVARRLVGDEELRPVRQCGAERDRCCSPPESSAAARRTIEQSDPLE